MLRAGRSLASCSGTLRPCIGCLFGSSTFLVAPQTSLPPLRWLTLYLTVPSYNLWKVTYLQLVFDFLQFFRKYFCFAAAGIKLLLQNLGAALKQLYTAVLSNVSDPVTLMIGDNTLGAYHNLVSFAEVLCFLLRVLYTILNLCSDFLRL